MGSLSMRSLFPLILCEVQRQASHHFHVGTGLDLAVFDRDHANQTSFHIENAAAGIAKEAIEVIERPTPVLGHAISTYMAEAALILQFAWVTTNENLITLWRLFGGIGVIGERLVY